MLTLMLTLAAVADTPAAPAAADGWRYFGQPMTVEVVTEAATLLAAPQDFVDKTIRVEGRVTDVCQQAGCWMVIAEGDQSMRVLMKDHSFSVDKNGTGATCQVEGTVVAHALDPEVVAHLESESSDVAGMPEKNAVDDMVYELQATGVALRE